MQSRPEGSNMDDSTRDYITRVQAAGTALISEYATATCPECEDVICGDGVVTAEDGAEHYVTGGAVIVGCEGYHVVNPNRVGIDAPAWQA